jgi:cardiolipin synthase A/B
MDAAMRFRNLRNRVRRAWPTLKRAAPRCVLALVTGCRSAAAPYSCDPGTSASPRATILALQVMEDSVRELASRPLRTGWHFVAETTDHVEALTGGEIGKRIWLPLCGTPEPLTPSNATIDLASFEKDLSHLTNEELQPASLQLQVNGAQSLEALDNLIAQATTRIDVIMFQWENDALGKAIAARLAAVAGPNLHVRILIDGGGNLFFSEPEDANASDVNRVISNLAQHPYIQVVRIRNPFARYDHRKLVIIDGRLAWTGGRNFCRDAFFCHHDLTFVLNGALVGKMQHCFDSYWENQGGQAPPDNVPESGPAPPVSEPNCEARLLESEPGNRQIANAIYEAVDQAKHHIYVENVYLSDSRLVVKLAEARRRGVDVRVVITVQSTTPTINQSNKLVANRLLHSGVRVYLFPGMTHVKALAIDGLWAYLGTANLDPLSLRHNHEMGLAISGCAVVLDLEQRLFLEDMRPERELQEPLPVTFHDWLCEWAASICL